MPDDPTMAVSKVLPKGLVPIPLEIRERLGLKPGAKMIVVAAEEATIHQKAEVLVSKKDPQSIVRRIQSIFSKVPIRDIVE